MLLVDGSYQKAVFELVASDHDVDVAIAFWGAGAEKHFLEEGRGTRRIVCNLTSGGTNPHVIRKLVGRSKANVEVKHCETLHAKVLIGTDTCIVGSANFSANGLGLEGAEVGKWKEAGYIVREADHIDQARQWFEKLWHDSDTITPGMFEEAEQNWARNRASRPRPKATDFLITEATWRSYLNRGIRLIIWRNWPSQEQSVRAAQDLEKRKSAISDHGSGVDGSRVKFDAYHNWGTSLCDTTASYIDVHYGRRGALTSYGARRPLATGHVSGKSRSSNTMDVMERVEDILGQSFAKKQQDTFVEWIGPILKENYEEWCSDAGGEDFVLELDEVLRLCFEPDGGEVSLAERQFEWLLESCQLLAKRAGMRCVTVATTPKQVRIGVGERSHPRSEEFALKKVSVLMWLSASGITFGSYLPPKRARTYGQTLRRQGKQDRSWIELSFTEAAQKLPELITESTLAFLTRSGMPMDGEVEKASVERKASSRTKLSPFPLSSD